jgi:23S rRNA (uracil1939-C5)-methyltransferase
MKINDKLTGVVERVDEKGRGVLKVPRSGIPQSGTVSKEALAYFVIPGETIEATVRARKEGTLRLRVDAISSPSADRVVPRCPYAGRCGGCPWQMIDYPRQCNLKMELVNRAFDESGALSLESRGKLQDSRLRSQDSNFVPADKIFYHRNRMDYVFGAGGELGLKEPERWAGVLDLSTCYMMSIEAVKIMGIVRDHVKKHAIKPWDNRAHTGFARYLVLREGKNTGERLVMFTTSAEHDMIPGEAELADALRPFATTFLHGINPEITDLSIPKKTRTIFGNPYLTERAGELTYTIPPAGFFQTNTEMAEVLRDTVVEFAAPCAGETVMDLYCGVGFLSLGLARDAAQVIGVELDESAIEAARVNAELNHISNVTFSAGAAEALLPTTLLRDKPSIIVVDPPRAGLHPKALAALMEYGAKRLIYVSCNPRSLARDLTELLKIYTPVQSRCIDLFPHTPHIETIVALELTKA